jgi:hypothetical protein
MVSSQRAFSHSSCDCTERDRRLSPTAFSFDVSLNWCSNFPATILCYYFQLSHVEFIKSCCTYASSAPRLNWYDETMNRPPVQVHRAPAGRRASLMVGCVKGLMGKSKQSSELDPLG